MLATPAKVKATRQRLSVMPAPASLQRRHRLTALAGWLRLWEPRRVEAATSKDRV